MQKKYKKKKTIKAFVKDINNDQNLLFILINLCKMHLKCLFSLSKNRNDDVTNKFFQLKIVDYLTKEIELENEAAEKIYKLNQFNNSIKENLNLENNKLEENLKNNFTESSDSINDDLNDDLNDDFFEEEESENENKDNLNEDVDKDEFDDLEDIPLVDPNIKVCSYESKIPKLNMIPTTFSGEIINNFDNVEKKKKKKRKKKNLDDCDLNISNNNKSKNNNNNSNINNSNNNNKSENHPKIQLKLNLDLCKTKSNKNELLKEEIKKKEEEEKKNNNNNSNNNNQPKIQLKLNLDLCKTKSDKNTKLKEEIKQLEKKNSITKINEIIDTSVKKPQTTFPNNSSSFQNKDSSSLKNYIQLPKLNLTSQKKIENISIDISHENPNNNINFKNPKITFNNNINLINNNNLNNNSTLAKKVQIEIENHLKEKYKLFYQKALSEGLTEHDLNNVNQFYLKERNSRLLYNDTEIQVLIISLLFSLIITPKRGTLEELYCSIFPYENNKLNILYIIHHHLNREENYHILPSLLKYICQIPPFGAGQRLLKLVNKKFFDSTLYSNWDKIGGGQFGTVFQCNTGIREPNIIAIKKTDVEQNIYSACRLFDVFTEVTALETFRLKNCVTQLYDYGCDEESYYIIMKRYPISLKQWRLMQEDNLEEMLPTYLSIFKDILEAVQIIHNNNTTHYDIKCDNIVLDFDPNEFPSKTNNKYNNNENKYIENMHNKKGLNSKNKENQYENISLSSSQYLPFSSSNNICIRVADFGECKIFLNEKDEYCTRSRGTDVIKSPEMLHHFGLIRKEDDNFDRRKKIGTTRSSDIWSLGCLFYELLTGKFLFEEIQDDYMGFIAKIDNNTINDLLSIDKLNLIGNNPYLVDFLKFMLIKEQNYRPNIETVIKRFEHVYALLVGGTGSLIKNTFNDNDLNKGYFSDDNFFFKCIENCEDMIFNVDNSWDNSFNKEDLFKGVKSIPEVIMLFKDIFICEFDYIEKFNNGNYNNNNGMYSSINTAFLHSINSNEVINNLLDIGITHIISFTPTHNKEIIEKFFYLNLLGTNILNNNENNNNKYNNILDINFNNNNQNKNLTSPFGYIYSTLDFLRHAMIYKGKVLFVDDYFYTNIPNKPNFFIRSIILIIFSYLLNQSAYDTYTFLNSKLLYFTIPLTYYLPQISNWVTNQNLIINYISSFPIYRCFCGACNLILKREYSPKLIKKCNCQKGHSSQQYSDCPSNGCNEYIEKVKKYYNINYDNLIWSYADYNNDFFIFENNNLFNKKIISLSRGLEENIIKHSINDKYSMKASGRKNTWIVFQCKICFCWLFGECENKIQILLNNEFNFGKRRDLRKKIVKENELKDLSLDLLI